MPNVPNILLRQTACWSSNGHTILTEEVTTAIKMSYPAVQISLDKFGISRNVNLGVLCGTFQQESRQALTKLLEAALHKPGFFPIPVKVTWESIYTRGEHQPASTKAHFIKCRMEDMAWAILALSKLYGSNITEHNPLCPLVRFIPMSALKTSDNAARKVITHQHQFLKSTSMASLKNFCPLERVTYSFLTPLTLLQYHTSSHPFRMNTTIVWFIL